MKRTSQELLEFFGLKHGDYIDFGDGNKYRISWWYGLPKLWDEKPSHEPLSIEFLVDREYTIIRTPKLTEDEKVILRNLPEEYTWIVRDDCVNALYVHATFPRRYEDIYMSGVCQRMELFEHLFQFITWEDEPYLIEDLLK